MKYARLASLIPFSVLFAQTPAEIERKLDTQIEVSLRKAGAPSVSVAVVEVVMVFVVIVFSILWPNRRIN